MKRFVGSTFALALAVGLGAGCPGDDGMGDTGEPDVEPRFPEDYESSYTEVRPCMGSGDHDLHNVRILADPDAVTPYLDRVDPFPTGSIVVKEEYDFGDTACTGEILQWTVMERLDEGSSPDTLDWVWQQVDAERRVVAEDLPRCIGCHQGCGVPPDGYAGTCAIL